MSRSYRRSEIIKYAGDTSWKRFLIASFAANIRMTLIFLITMLIVK